MDIQEAQALKAQDTFSLGLRRQALQASSAQCRPLHFTWGCSHQPQRLSLQNRFTVILTPRFHGQAVSSSLWIIARRGCR